jgi:hypothetical protein
MVSPTREEEKILAVTIPEMGDTAKYITFRHIQHFFPKRENIQLSFPKSEKPVPKIFFSFVINFFVLSCTTCSPEKIERLFLCPKIKNKPRLPGV